MRYTNFVGISITRTDLKLASIFKGGQYGNFSFSNF